jgi:hypothetical protein
MAPPMSRAPPVVSISTFGAAPLPLIGIPTQRSLADLATSDDYHTSSTSAVARPAARSIPLPSSPSLTASRSPSCHICWSHKVKCDGARPCGRYAIFSSPCCLPVITSSSQAHLIK